MSTKKKNTVWLGQMEYAGYTLTCIGSTEDLAKEALAKGFRKAVKHNHFHGNLPRNPERAFDYFGAWFTEIVVDAEAEFLT